MAEGSAAAEELRALVAKAMWRWTKMWRSRGASLFWNGSGKMESEVKWETRWWFQIFFILHPYMGKWSNLMFAYFSTGWWKTHQLGEDELPSQISKPNDCLKMIVPRCFLEGCATTARVEDSKEGCWNATLGTCFLAFRTWLSGSRPQTVI